MLFEPWRQVTRSLYSWTKDYEKETSRISIRALHRKQGL